MSAKIIDGKAIAEKIRADLKKQISKLKDKPGLAFVRVGDDPASKVYVNLKKKACEEAGIHSEVHLFEEKAQQQEVIDKVMELNKNPNIHGILVQLPLPKHIDEQAVLEIIDPFKDVDGFSPVNIGHLLAGFTTIVPATPRGIIHLIKGTGVKIEGKHAVVVGRSNIVGKPISLLLQQENATVTMCHSRSKPLENYTKQADILIVAIGRPEFIKGNMIKDGAIVIDVGVNKLADPSRERGYRLVGDVEFSSAEKTAGFITPVPKGVGPMTIAMVLKNTLSCYELLNK